MSEACVLVVDDDKNVRETIRDVLQLEGIAVRAVEPSTDIESFFDDGAVRLVVTDLNMPVLDGVDLVTRVGALAKSQGRKIPVFVVTGAGGESRVEEALRLGAAGYFPKPFELEEFVERIRSELEAVS